MAQNETWLKHDLMKAVRVQYLDGNLFSMDNAGNLIGVTLTRDGEDYAGGGSVSANVIRADGGTVTVIGSLSGNAATVVLPQAAYVVPGAVSIVVKLTASGQVTTIAAIVANVYRSSTDTPIDPGTIIPSVQALISAIDSAVASIPADYSSLWASLAPAFSTSSAYTAGQYVTYNGGLYRFTTDHAAGAWNSAHVASVNIGGELSALKSAINNRDDDLYSVQSLFPSTATVTVGQTINNSGQPINNAKRCLFERWRYDNVIWKMLGILGDTYKYVVAIYTANDSSTFVRKLTDDFTDERLVLPNDGKYFYAAFKRNDNADMTSSDAAAILEAFVRYQITDNTLSMLGVPADAKKTGDEINNANNEINNVKNETNNAINAYPWYNSTFTVQSGSVHYSTSDAIAVEISAYEHFIANATNGSIIATYTDDTTETLSSSGSFNGVKAKAIKSIGIYWNNTTGSNVIVNLQVIYGKRLTMQDNLDSIADIDLSVTKTNSEVLHWLYNDSGTPTSASSIDATEIMDVKTGSIIKFVSELPSGYHALLFYDESNNIIETYGTGRVINGVYQVSNPNIKYVRFQSRNASGTQAITADIKIFEPSIGTQNRIRIYKRSASIFDVFVPGGNGGIVQYEWDKYYKKWDSLTYTDAQGNTQTATDIVSSDFWNNLNVKNGKTNTTFAQGHSNFICCVLNEPYYIGDGHGNEVSISFSMLADGKEVNIDSLRGGGTIYCDELRIISKSYMYECESYSSGEHMGAKPKLDTSGNPVVDFVHMMEIHYEVGNVVTINNKLLVMKNNLSFRECFGAMLDCYYGTFDTVICNNAESTMNSIADDGTCSIMTGSTINLRTNNVQYSNMIEMFGENYYISQKMLNDNPTDIGKSSVYFEFYSNDLKCYFTPVRTSRRYPDTSNPEVFNVGDVISVTDVRKIELYN